MADVSASNPAVVAVLSTRLNTQATRPGITYAARSGGNPLLADPNGDGDKDGVPNGLEYAAGTGGLDSADRPQPVNSFEDLTTMGFSNHELVYCFPLAAHADDFTPQPFTSTDLHAWYFKPLEFLDAVEMEGKKYEARFRITEPTAPRRFFRLGLSEE